MNRIASFAVKLVVCLVLLPATSTTFAQDDDIDELKRRIEVLENATTSIEAQAAESHGTLRVSIENLEGFLPKLMQDISSDFAEIRAVQASMGRQIDEVGGELVANTIDVKRLGKKHEALDESTASEE